MKDYTNMGPLVIDPTTEKAIPKDNGNKDWQRVQAEIAAGEAQLVSPS